MRNAIICDIDGTLALHKHRSPYDYDMLHTDEVNEPVLKALRRLRTEGDVLLIVSGRPDSHQNQTGAWLERYRVRHNRLFMRPVDDKRSDTIVKQEIYEEYIEGRYNVLWVLDDRDRVVKMWRSLGLTVFQVAEGDF